MVSSTTDLIIIGAGAGGLMAACSAAEAGLRCLLVERRHRPGLKLLLCGNNRCNISHAGSAEALSQAYGHPVGPFLRPALENFPPARLREWFAAAGLPTTVLKDRIYPRSEKADDVLHCFTDCLREREVPLLLNCPVRRLRRDADGFTVEADGVILRAPRVILATGGVSYPKTGSVGDGQRFAEELGLRVEPLRPGLAALEGSQPWQAALPPGRELNLPAVTLELRSGNATVETFSGNLLLDGLLLRGTAAFDAARCAARRQLEPFSVRLNLFPGLSATVLAQRLQSAWQKCRQTADALNVLGLDRDFCQALAPLLTPQAGNWPELAARLQQLDCGPVTPRPVKEAITTIGGIALDEIDPETLECRRCPGLYCIGEVMDIDGPTGGYNLHAAFATARLAVAAMTGKRHGRTREIPAAPAAPANTATGGPPRPRNASRANKSAWGKNFWDGYMQPPRGGGKK